MRLVRSDHDLQIKQSRPDEEKREYCFTESKAAPENQLSQITGDNCLHHGRQVIQNYDRYL